MKKKMTLKEIQLRLEKQAKKMLIASGYTILPDIAGESGRPNPDPGERGFVVDLRVAGYNMHYDGWDCELVDSDWDEILSAPWKEDDKQLLEYLRQRGNVRVCLPDAEKALQKKLYCGRNSRSNPADLINRQLSRFRLRYHVGLVHVNGNSKFRHPTMIKMFKRPMDTSDFKE